MGQTCSRHGRDDQKTSKKTTLIANILCGYTEDNGDESASDVSKGQTGNNEHDKIGQARIVDNPESSAQVKNCVRTDRRRNVRSLSMELNTSLDTAYAVVQVLGYHKACSQWVPHPLTDTHQEHRMSVSLEHLKQ
jgi:hypothetical protein